jgi:hypothetical protein
VNKSKGKHQVRDVQDQTGWPYQHAKFLVEQLGYSFVSEAVDSCPPGGYDVLRTKAREAQRIKAGSFVRVAPKVGGPR